MITQKLYLLKRLHISVLSLYSWKDDRNFFSYLDVMNMLSESNLNFIVRSHFENNGTLTYEFREFEYDCDYDFEINGALKGTLKTKPL